MIMLPSDLHMTNKVLHDYTLNQQLELTDVEQRDDHNAIADQSHLECGWTNARYIVPCPRWVAIPSFPMPAHRPNYFPSTPKLID